MKLPQYDITQDETPYTYQFISEGKRGKIYKNGSELYLSFLQNKIFWLFAYNLNKLVTYEMIEEFVYDSTEVSKAAIQNVVLRLKRELGVKFKNISESGYILVVPEYNIQI